MLTPDKRTRFRTRRSSQHGTGEKQTEKDQHSEGHNSILRKHASKAAKNDAKLNTFPTVKNNSNAGFHPSKKKEPDVQATKRHKQTFTKNLKELSIKEVAVVVMEKRHPQSKNIQLKEKGNAGFMKHKKVAKLANASKSSKGHIVDHKEKKNPNNVYQQPLKYITNSNQSAVKTNNLLPLSKTNKKGSRTWKSMKKQVHVKIFSKKQKRILAMLQKMPKEVFREYLNRKGLDKYWKVVENLTKISTISHTNKRFEMRAKLDKHNNKSFAHTKAKLNGGKSSYNKQAKGWGRKVSQIMVHIDTVTDREVKKFQKVERLKHPSIRNENNITTEMIELRRSKAHRNKKESHEYSSKKTEKQHSLSNSFHSKDTKKIRLNELYPENDNKREAEMMQSDFGKRMQAPKLSSTDVSLPTTPKEMPSQMKKSVKQGARKTSANDSKILEIKNMYQLSVEAFKGKPMPNNAHKLVKINDLSKKIKVTKSERQQRKNTIKQKAKTTTNRHLSKTMKANHKSKEITQTSPDSHGIKSKQFHQTTYDNSSTQLKHPALRKIDYLKEKIRDTNNLKFKVAQALLAHCETQNRLRQVFDEVNSSLRKATLLARAIGKTFGMKQDDIMKMKSEHNEVAVEQFLNQLF